MPIISVIMSVYNEKEEWLIESIQSILNQTFKDFEFIIIIDNPRAENLISIINKFAKEDKRIIVIRNEQNIGLVKSLNKGLELSTGKFIARMDADDISHINRFETQLEFLVNGNYDLVASRVEYIDENGEVLYKQPLYGKDVESCKKSLMYKSILMHPTWFFRKEILSDLVKYNDVNSAEDYDFLCRLFCCKFIAINQDKVLLRYRIRSNSITVGKAFQQHKVSKIVRNEYRKSIIKRYNYDTELVLKKVSKVNFNTKYRLYDKGTIMYNLACKYLRNRQVIKFITCLIITVFISPGRIYDLIAAAILKIIN